jgi:hemoglobin-like flavoprotein
MAERDIELFNDSLERCTGSPGFLDRFYELFMTSSEEVAAKFKHTDFRKQKQALRVSLYKMMLVPEGNAGANAELERLAQLHSRRQLDVRPELYDLWLDRLIQAVREFDPLFSGETEKAWRNVMRPGIEFMKARY